MNKVNQFKRKQIALKKTVEYKLITVKRRATKNVITNCSGNTWNADQHYMLYMLRFLEGADTDKICSIMGRSKKSVTGRLCLLQKAIIISGQSRDFDVITGIIRDLIYQSVENVFIKKPKK